MNDNPEYFGSGKIIKYAMQKYGKENFKKEVLCRCLNRQELSQQEIYWIEQLNPPYNIAKGGNGGDTYTNNPNKENIRKKHSAHSTGENNPMYGKSIYDVWFEKYDKETAAAKEAKHRMGLSNMHKKNKGGKMYDWYLAKYGKEEADKWQQWNRRSRNSGVNNRKAKKVIVYNEDGTLNAEFSLVRIAATHYGYCRTYFGKHMDRIVNNPKSPLYKKKVIFEKYEV